MKNRAFQIIETILLLFCSIQCGRDIYARYAEFLSKGKIVPTFLFICVVLLFGTLFMLTLIWKNEWLTLPRKLKRHMRSFNLVIAFLLCLFPGILYNFIRSSEPYHGLWIRIFLSLFCVILAAWFWERESEIHFNSLLSCALIFSTGFVLLTQFHDVTDYPFSIGWSEGNRMWDYSVLFGKSRFNYPQDQTIPAYIDIGRQSLWGLIYLFPGTNIVTARIWNDILFTIPCALLGWALLVKNKSCRRYRLLAYSLWSMLFLMQGPIYTPLTLAAILVALGSRTPIVINCILTAAAGFYAVMSRSTWIAAPSAFAVFLLFLDQKAISSSQEKHDRWGKSIALGLSGLIGAGIYMKRDVFARLLHIGTQSVNEPAAASAAATEAMEAVPQIFTPAWFQYYLGRQALLFDRLWPNETYKPGIVLGLALAVLPAAVLILIWAYQRKWHLDVWQKLLLFAGSGIFLAAGLIFSVKIGGGSNLHNLDMFLILMLIISALAWKAGMGEWLAEKIRFDSTICLILLAAILIPCWDNLSKAVPRVYPKQEITEDAVEKIRTVISEHEGEDILFMDQRQMLTFGTVPKIPLIADYEKKWMMDEAMANDAAYFEPYIRDLKSQRFAAIISEPLHIKFQGSGGDFSEENDLFVTYVSVPTLCYYEPYETFPEQGVEILIPRQSVLEMEGVTCP
ncbi:MAG: hypothetical protein IJI14_17510 [Anaerolineaceae bacterium]|nr:hypothetical protein [Anaerolineaceae bacterium]